MSMSIPSVGSVSAYQQALLAQQVQIATLAKANDVAKSQGEAVLALLDTAVEINAQMTGASGGASGGDGIDVVA